MHNNVNNHSNFHHYRRRPQQQQPCSVKSFPNFSCILALFLTQTIHKATCWTVVTTPIPRLQSLSSQSCRSSSKCRASLLCMAGTMEVWLDLQPQQSQSSIKESVLKSRMEEADVILVNNEQTNDATLELATTTTKTTYTVDTNNKPPFKLYHQKGTSEPIGAIVNVSTPAGQDFALGLIGSVEWILITCPFYSSTTSSAEEGWIMIPAENLLSACQNTGTKIAAYVENVGDVGGLARALELGVDALCVHMEHAVQNKELWDVIMEAKRERLTTSAAMIEKDEIKQEKMNSGPSIVQGTCKRITKSSKKPTVLADRVCIDFLQNLLPTEGCWIGSSSKITALILSEASQSSFVPSRPFRVNAGPVHSYVVMGDGISTKYLAEVEAGDEVLVYDVVSGKERSVAVGRLKVEVRPCVQVGLFVSPPPSSPQKNDNEETQKIKTQNGQVFLQQAETVRLGQEKGESSFVRVTDLDSSGRDSSDDDDYVNVLLRVVESGTHVGKAYTGKVVEK